MKRHNRCRGLVLFRWGNRQLEIWFCPKDEVIEPHVHQRIDSTIIFLWGMMMGTIGEKTGLLDQRDIGRLFHIPAGGIHSARMEKFTVFANWEKWIGEPSSAADDFTAA